MAPSPRPVCETCEKPLVSWPWRHQGHLGAAGPQIASPKVGDQYACQTALCNRYGLVLRISLDGRSDFKSPPRPPSASFDVRPTEAPSPPPPPS